MSPSTAQPVIDVDDAHRVSGLLLMPPRAHACFVLAHGAGAGMTHPFMEAVATELGMRGVATLRYQFPYMERGAKRPDLPSLAHAAVRGAVAEAARLAPGLALIAGGKSFGGRMTSQAQAASPLPGVRGLAFLGFPLHPAGRPADDRGGHLSAIHVPMLFLQGERDKLADHNCSVGSSSGWARAPPSGCSRMPIIPSICLLGRDGRTRKAESSYWMRLSRG